ncbi:MAG: hypothetical protein N4A33_10200 [Bacteriovoracaceae bacterium]|jgi:hypothetical protein|nr:hypothetical protein [Bacteriovoracaceae bacterium]
MKKIYLIFIILPLYSYAEINLSAGPTFIKSDHAKSSDSSHINEAGRGFGAYADAEIVSPFYISLNLALQYSAESLSINYNYTNPKDSSEVGQLNNLSTIYSRISAAPSIRVYFLNMNKLKLFVGFGKIYGLGSFIHNQEEYEEQTGSSSGFLESAELSFSGNIKEAGLKYFWKKKFGLQVSYKQEIYETTKIATLNNNKIDRQSDQVIISYIAKVN